MSFLQIDYDKAIAQAKELESAAEQCGRSLNDLRDARGASEAYWVGVSGNAMRLQIEAAESDLSYARDQLISIAASIRRVADELKRADETVKGAIESFRDFKFFI